jgi:hypothetical protein
LNRKNKIQEFGTISQSSVALNSKVIPKTQFKNPKLFLTLSDSEPFDFYRYLNVKYPLVPKVTSDTDVDGIDWCKNTIY